MEESWEDIAALKYSLAASKDTLTETSYLRRCNAEIKTGGSFFLAVVVGLLPASLDGVSNSSAIEMFSRDPDRRSSSTKIYINYINVKKIK